MNADASHMSTSTSAGQYRYENVKHCISGFKSMLNLQRNKLFCDVTLTVGHEEYSAHRVVLAAVSPYFADMLRDKEANKVVDLDFESVSSLSFALVLEFIYSGKVTLTNENLKDLVVISKRLEITSLEVACSEAMIALLSPSNWFRFKALAEKECSEEVCEKCRKYALDHFTQVVEAKDFLQLSTGELSGLVGKANVSEEEKYLAVMKWVKHDLTRKDNLFELLRNIRMPLMDNVFFMKNVLSEDLLRTDVRCMNLLLDYTASHLVPEPKTPPLSKKLASEVEIFIQISSYIVVTGGSPSFSFGRTAMSECEYYDLAGNTWRKFASMGSKRSQHAVVGFEKLLFAFGGCNNQGALSSVEYYDPARNAWSLTTPLPYERFAHGGCSLNGSIFIGGGRDKVSNILSNVVEFQPSIGRYKTCPAMKTARRGLKMVAAGNCIYAVGGWCKGMLNSVERLDPREGIWSPAPSMGSLRVDHGVTVLNDCIYCTGGFVMLQAFDGKKSGERFDIRANKWESIPDMISPRCTHELVALNGCIYAVGSGRSVEKFDPVSNRWTEMPAMLSERYFLGASVLHDVDITLARED